MDIFQDLGFFDGLLMVIWGVPENGSTPSGCLKIDNPTKMDDLEVPPF